MKYKVNYSGFCYVEADTELEAEDLFFEELYAYEEHEVTSIEEVDDFLVEL